MPGPNEREIKLTLKGDDKASQPIKRVGDAVAVTSRHVDKLEDQFEEAEAAAKDLDSQIDRLGGSMKALAIQIAQTDDDGIRKQLEAQLRLEQREQNRLKRLRKTIGEVGDDLTDMGKRSFNLLGGAFASLPPPAQAAVAAAGAAIAASLTSVVGAAISAGIGIGLGGGVLALGIKAAANSPRVKSAWQAFGMAAKEATRGFGEAFEAPLARAAVTFAAAITRIANAGVFRDLAAAMAPVIDKLAPALAQMAEKAMPGLVNAVQQMAPLFDTLAEKAPKIGAAISRFFDTIAAGAPGANAFLSDLLDFLAGLIVVVGTVITAFANMYLAIKNGAIAAKKAVGDAFKGLAVAALQAIGTIVTGAAKAFAFTPLGPALKDAAKKFWAFAATVNSALASIDDEVVKVTVKVQGKIAGGGSAEVGFGPAGKATGGPISPGQTYLVGEQGPELITPGRSGYVHTAQETAAMMGARSGTTPAMAGTQHLVVTLQWPDGTVAGRIVAAGLQARGGPAVPAMVEALRYSTRTQAAGDVQRHLGR